MEELKEKTEVKKTVESKVETVTSTLTILEKVKNFTDKHGVVSTFNTMLITVILVIFGYVIYHPEAILDRVQDIVQERHEDGMRVRLNADPYIRTELKDLRLSLQADRTFIVEAHNGGSNLASLPFLYVDMTYEETGVGVPPLMGAYRNLSLQKYSFFQEIYSETYWFGHIDELKEVDELFYLTVKGDGVNYIGLLVLYGKNSVIGAIGVEYCDEPKVSKSMIHNEMLKRNSRFTDLLTYDRKRKKY